MRKTVNLTEADLHRIINQCVNEALEDEGFFGNIGRGIKNAFGGDASRAAAGARRMGNSVGGAIRQAGNAVAQGARQAAGAVKQGAENFGKGVSQRYNAAKAGFEDGQKNDKIDGVIKSLQELQQQGILHGAATNQVIKELMGQLGKLKGSNNSNAAAYRNQIGR